MVRGTATIYAATILATVMIGFGAASAEAQSYYTVDPYDVPQPAWGAPTYSASTATMYQMNPFGVGYNLLSGYRTIYSGARQAVGHELIGTHDNGAGYNGYVYRPIYGPSPGYRYSVGGALVVEYPNVRYPAPVYLPADAPQVTPATFELPLPPAAAPEATAPDANRGPREF